MRQCRASHDTNHAKTHLAMKMKETFALIIRVIAVLGLGYVARNLVNDVLLGHVQPLAVGVGKRLVFLLLGLYFLRGAPHVLRFAYPEEAKSAAAQP